ncbi:MAG TPA: hypothetical protein VNU71_20590, partial [Burkholderiaceae bacterium]|nr:hypothetical protein [Burkholderiaceae bacterium]
MSAPRLAPRRGALALAAVVALHVALWFVVRAPMRPATAGAARLSVRVLPAPRPMAEAQRAEAQQRDAAATRATARPRDSAEPPV